jgi:hypothetical protein
MIAAGTLKTNWPTSVLCCLEDIFGLASILSALRLLHIQFELDGQAALLEDLKWLLAETPRSEY